MTPQRPDRNLALDLARVTEAAALAAARWVGRGAREDADLAALDAMRLVLDSVEMDGIVVIGEGEKDDAPMLFNGDRVGNGNPPETDIAVDPIEGTTATANGRPNAMSVIAVSDRGTMFDPGPCRYMNKLAVGPEGVGVVDITASATDNLRALAAVKKVSVRDLTVVVLDRQRHHELIAEIQETGARIRMIGDNDVGAAISTATPGTGVDILLGVGGSPEAVISAAALRCMGGEQQGQLWPRNANERQAAIQAGLDLDAVLSVDDLVRSDNCFFAATGITDGDLLKGVRYSPSGVWTHSLVMRSKSGTVRRIDARHHLDKISSARGFDFR